MSALARHRRYASARLLPWEVAPAPSTTPQLTSAQRLRLIAAACAELDIAASTVDAAQGVPDPAVNPRIPSQRAA